MEKKKKFFEIKKDLAEVDRLVNKSIEDISYNRKMNDFYEVLYNRLYPTNALENRAFVNIGPGNFRHKYWTNVDKGYEGETWGEARGNRYKTFININWDAYEHQAIDIESNSVELVYSSHCIEHMWNEDANFLFSEVARILKPGGVLRLVVPDASLSVEAYKRGDWAYLAHYYWRKGKRSDFESYADIGMNRSAFYFLDQFSLLTTEENGLYFKPSECKAYVESFTDLYEMLENASEKSDLDLNKRLGKHVNWFNYEKLETMLKKHPFTNILRSGYGQSLAPVLRDTRIFDKTDPEMSLFVDVVK